MNVIESTALGKRYRRTWALRDCTLGGWLLAVSVLLIGGAVALIRRRGACGSSPKRATGPGCGSRHRRGSRGPPESGS